MATSLPAISDLTSSTTTEGGAKTWFTNLRAFLSGLLGADGKQGSALSALGALLSGDSSTAGAYSVSETDRGQVIECTSTLTVSIASASDLGSGFTFAVWNSGSGTVTIAPYVSEFIDGATTKVVPPGACLIVYCNGSKFVTAGAALPDMTGKSGWYLSNDGSKPVWTNSGVVAGIIPTPIGTVSEYSSLVLTGSSPSTSEQTELKRFRSNYAGTMTIGAHLSRVGTTGWVQTIVIVDGTINYMSGAVTGTEVWTTANVNVNRGSICQLCIRTSSPSVQGSIYHAVVATSESIPAPVTHVPF